VEAMLRPRSVLVALTAVLAVVPLASGQLADTSPPQLDAVGVTERLDAQLPREAVFTDENGTDVRLGQYLAAGRPVVLTLNYYRCPMLCGLQLNGLLAGFKELDWTAGDEFEVVTVSIDPRETPTLARLKKQSFMTEYGRPEAVTGWHFLTGREEPIRAVASAVGFSYRYDERDDQYAHAAAIVVLTPVGHVARYLYGIEYPARDLRLAVLVVGSALGLAFLREAHRRRVQPT